MMASQATARHGTSRRARVCSAASVVQPVPKPGPPSLPPGMPVGAAFGATLAALDARLGEMVRDFLESDSGPPSVETVHQARVAERRLRAALDAWRGLSQRKESARLKDELKWLHGRFGPVRDLDVFKAGTLIPLIARYGNGSRAAGLAALAAEVDGARARAAQQAARSVATVRYARLSGRIARWAAGGWPVRASANLETPVEVFAARALECAYARVLKAIEAARGRHEEEGGAALHAVRIEIKKLRYAAQFFSTTFEGPATARWIKALTRLQDTLGAMQDAEAVAQTARRLTRKRGRMLREAGDIVVQDARKRRHKALGRIEKLTDRFLEMTPFWR